MSKVKVRISVDRKPLPAGVVNRATVRRSIHGYLYGQAVFADGGELTDCKTADQRAGYRDMRGYLRVLAKEDTF